MTAPTHTLASALTLVDEFAKEIADLLDVAASDADVELNLEGDRTGKLENHLAEALVNRLVADGWSFSHNEADEATR